MSMFDGYDNPTIHNDCPTYPNYNHPEIRTPWYSKPSPRIDNGTIFWYFGDVINLPIEITGQIWVVDTQQWVDIADFLVDRKVDVIIKDFRGETIYSKIHDGLTSNVVNFELSYSESTQIPKGSYTLHLDVYTLDEELIKRLVANSQYPIVIE